MRAASSSAYFAALDTTWIPNVVGSLATDFPGAGLDLHVTDVVEPDRRPRLDRS